MSSYDNLVKAVNALHDHLMTLPYSVQYDGITVPFSSLKRAYQHAAMRSRIGVTITGIFKGRKCLALYQAGRRI